jgi:hypothetical protein
MVWQLAAFRGGVALGRSCPCGPVKSPRSHPVWPGILTDRAARAFWVGRFVVRGRRRAAWLEHGFWRITLQPPSKSPAEVSVNELLDVACRFQWPSNSRQQDSLAAIVAWPTWRGPTQPVKSAESPPGGSASSPPRTTRLDTIQSGGKSFGWRLSLSDAKFCSTQ